MWKTTLLYGGFVCGILIISIPAAHADVNIENPIGPRTMTIPDLIASVSRQLIPVAVVIAVFAIIVIGFRFVIAAVQGDASGLKEARKNLLWVLIGIAVVVGAYSIATIARNVLNTL